MGLFSVPLVGGVSIVNKISAGVKEISSSLACPAPTSCRDAWEAAQHLGPKVLRRHVFFSSSCPFFLSYLCSPSTLLCLLLTPLVTPSPPETCSVSSVSHVSFCWKLFGTVTALWTPTKRHISVLTQSVAHPCLDFVMFFLSPSFPCLFSPWPACSTVEGDCREER